MKRSIIIAATLLASGVAQGAGVFRCTDKDGAIIYSDTACADIANRATVNIDPPSSDLYWRPGDNSPPPVHALQRGGGEWQPGSVLMVNEGSWAMHGDNWRVASQYSKVHCIKLHPGDYSLQAACMRNAQRGFDELRGNYDMPPEIAQQTKAHCIQMHPEDFSLQAACMRNQSSGYREMR